MKRFVINDFAEVAEAMYDEMINNRKECVVFIGYYDDAMEVVRELSLYDDLTLYSVELHPVDINGYTKEYYVTITNQLKVICEPAWSMKHELYLSCDADIVFIADDCNSAILKQIYSSQVVEVTYDEEIGCEGCCGECDCDIRTCTSEDEEEVEEGEGNSVTTHVAIDDDGHIRGFEKTWSHNENGFNYYSHYEHYSTDEDLVRQLMNDFKIKLR